jgi:cobalamin biosynthesis protein CobD/CbiB
MYDNSRFSDNYFTQGHKTLTRGIFILGGTLFLLAVFIFAFPTMIAYCIAGVILVTGISVLTVAWKLWRFREQASHIEKVCDIKNDNYRKHVSYFRGYL